MHNLKVPSFFLTNKTGTPQGEKLGLMKLLSINSCNYTLSSLSSVGAIRYGGIEIGVVQGIRSIPKSKSRSGGIPGNSSKNTSGN